MSRQAKQAAVVFVVVVAAAQLVRPQRANPPTDASRTIQAQVGTASGLVAVPAVTAGWVVGTGFAAFGSCAKTVVPIAPAAITANSLFTIDAPF